MNRRSLMIGGAALAAGAGGVAISFGRMGSPEDYAQAMSALRAPLGAEGNVRDLVRFATLAANGHNTQPWRFRIGKGQIRISPDLSRRTPAVDPDNHHLYVSLGCAAENLRLAAQARGLIGAPVFDPAGEGAIQYEHSSGTATSSTLCDAIPMRQSTRAAFDSKAPSTADLEVLEGAARTPGVDLVIITDRKRIDLVRDLVIAGNDAQMADPAFMAELKAWLRFNPRMALERGDGLFSGSSGNPSLPGWLGPAMFDVAFKPKAENEKYAQQIATSGGLAVFVGAKADHEHWTAVGRACQRFALQATALGMRLSFINQPVEVASLRPALAALVGAPGARPDIVMRFGYGAPTPMSPRRPVEAVIET
jgi:hypothetical protein